MSADNWAVCPGCRANAEVQALEPVDDDERFRTFREDYEFDGAEEGTITAYYSGHCTVCRLSVKLRHSKQFWTGS